MDSIPQMSGIYVITCAVNKKIYIGSAVNLRARWGKHLSELRRDMHHNKYLQRAWNKYGEDAFTFEILEFVARWVLRLREQYWLDKLRPFDDKGFNFAHNATSPALGLKFPGKVISQETRDKLRIANINRVTPPEQMEKMRQATIKTYIVTSPSGIEETVNGLRPYCLSHGLDESCMVRVARGKQPNHKGWKCRYA